MSLLGIERKLANRGIVYLDGATGTELQRRGAPMADGAWCGLATETHADLLRSIHEDYIRAGADVITTNTFATSRSVLGPIGLGRKVESLNRRAVDIALQARERASGERPVAVAGSMSHWRPWNRHELDRKVLPSDQEMADNFGETAELLARSGCDLILAEMMCHPEWAPMMVRAARATGLPVWVGLSTNARPDGTLATHGEVDVPFDEVLEPVVAEGGDVIGIMHTHVALVAPALEMLRRQWSGRLMVYPDAGGGTGRGSGWTFDESVSPAVFAEACREWADAGVRILGGCCGLWVDHIEAMVAALGDRGGASGG